MKKMYIVKWSEDTDDEKTTHTIFVTESKETAEIYIKKFNGIRDKWMTIMTDLMTKYNGTHLRILDRYWDIVEIKNAYFEEIDLR